MNPIRFAAAGALCLVLSPPAGAYGTDAPVLETARPAAATFLAANQSKKKKQADTYSQRRKSNCGYPQPPNQAGMSEYCSMMYNIYCRRGVGCSIYGR